MKGSEIKTLGVYRNGELPWCRVVLSIRDGLVRFCEFFDEATLPSSVRVIGLKSFAEWAHRRTA